MAQVDQRHLWTPSTVSRCLRAGTAALGTLVIVAPGLPAQEQAPVKRPPSAVACEVVTAEDIAKHGTVKRALRATVTGVLLTSTSGQAGAGTAVRLRGVGTMRSTYPMVFMDGLRVSGPGGAGQDIGILDQLNPEDVLLIEVFRGPAATTLYGTEAAGGVIRIYTKHGDRSAELVLDQRARCVP